MHLYPSSIRAKLLLIGLMLSIIPMIVLLVITGYNGNAILNIVGSETTSLAISDLDHIAKGVYSMCKAQQEVIQDSVNKSLNVARDILKQSGSVKLSDETVSWQAVNQFSKDVKTINLPKMMIGEKWTGKVTSSGENALVVDKLKQLVGGTCTIFQKMNDQGDMLRISTNVLKKNGARAIGTYIPKTNPDGRENPVVTKVLRGDTYRGKAFVVNSWYITAYEPLYDVSKKIIGMLYVGVPQERALSSLRKEIIDIKVGDTGYVFVLDSQGYYIISKDGKRDGENIWNVKDLNGAFPIKDMVKKAYSLKVGEIGEHTYLWKNEGEGKPRLKISRFIYFEPWDWIIGAGSYLDEFHAAEKRINYQGKQMAITLFIVSVITLLSTVIVWVWVAQRLSFSIVKVGDMAKKIGEGNFTVRTNVSGTDEVGVLATSLDGMRENLSGMIRTIEEEVHTLSDMSDELSESATTLSGGADETSTKSETVANSAKEMSNKMTFISQSSEETSANVNMVASATEEMTATVQEIAKNCEKARAISSDAVNFAKDASEKVGILSYSANDISKVTEVITEISEQTNLLALNATIEAARAGEAGKGFAVVANEIKELAKQTAESTSEIKSKIDEIQSSTSNATAGINQISTVISEVDDIVSTIASALEEQTSTTLEISENVSQASLGIGEVNESVVQSAHVAENVASEISDVSSNTRKITQNLSSVKGNAEKLNELSTRLKDMMGQFKID